MDRARPLTVNSYRFLKTIGKVSAYLMMLMLPMNMSRYNWPSQGAYAEVKLATKVDDQNPRDGDTGDRWVL